MVGLKSRAIIGIGSLRSLREWGTEQSVLGVERLSIGPPMPFPVDIVNETERKLGVKFPPSFVVRMVKNNVDEVSISPEVWQLYSLLDSSDRKRLARICNDIIPSANAPGLPVGCLRSQLREPARTCGVGGAAG